MKISALAVSLVLCFAFCAPPVSAGPFKKKSQKEATVDTRATIERFKEKDPSIKEFFKKANGYAVFPSVAKGGFGFGGAFGRGQLYEGKELLGTTTLKQASFGLQLGGQTYSEIIFFETSVALEKFKFGKYELGAQVSAVAITAGAAAGAQFNNGIAVFTMTNKGLMYEAAVAGQKFTFKPKK